MYFSSDNYTGASEQVFSYLQQANAGSAVAYGNDSWSERAQAELRATFECQADVYFVSTGTAANALALSALAKPWDSIVCHGQAHILNDELTAPEFFTGGARLIGLDKQLPKLSLASLESLLTLDEPDLPHNSKPTILSLTQLNECGQTYSREELQQFCELAHRCGLKVHLDGARFANAVVAAGCSPAELSWQTGVDVLTLGATKNGALAAEAVIFFDPDLGRDFASLRKRSGHLLSKGRWLGAQFCGWLHADHWLELARHANAMAAKLGAGIEKSEHAELVWPVCGNEVFAILAQPKVRTLRAAGAVFYDWPKGCLPRGLPISAEQGFVRLVASFRTTAAEVDQFLSHL